MGRVYFWLSELRKEKLLNVIVILLLDSRGIVNILVEMRNEEIGMGIMCFYLDGLLIFEMFRRVVINFFFITIEEKCINIIVNVKVMVSRRGLFLWRVV